MVLFGLLVAFQSGLLSDARLVKPTDFDVSLRQITDFCSEVTTASGVQLSVAKNVQDLKVDVFVEKRPLAETLDKVAKVLNCEWVPVEKGYRLEMDIPTMNHERNFNRAEDEEDRRVVEQKLWAFEYVAQRIPPSNTMTDMGGEPVSQEARMAITAPYRKAYADSYVTKDLRKIAEAGEALQVISDAVDRLENVAIGRVLMQMDKPAKEQFWKGSPVMAATIQGNDYKLWPSDMANRMQISYPSPDGVRRFADQFLFQFMAFDPIRGTLDVNNCQYAIMPKEFGGGAGTSRSNGPFAWSSSSVPIGEALKKLPFYQNLLPWMDFESVSSKFGQAINTKTPEWPSPWFGGRRRLGEHLRWFHLASGIPIVAQADRSCVYYWPKLQRSYAIASIYIKELTDNFGTYCKEDNGFFLARNYRYWSHRRHEVSEPLWQKLEPKHKLKSMGLKECLDFALNLREDQMHTKDIRYPLCKVDLGKVLEGYDMLRFYAGLSTAQRQQALQESGLGTESMSAFQVQEMNDLVKKLAFKSGSLSFEMAKYLFTSGVDVNVARQMRLRLVEDKNYRHGTYLDELKDGDEVLEKGGQVHLIGTQLRFNFVLGEDQTLGQSISVMDRVDESGGGL
jgi:hypothetical protein